MPKIVDGSVDQQCFQLSPGGTTTAVFGNIRAMINQAPKQTKRRLLSVYAFLLVFNLGLWIAAVIASRSYPFVLPTALLAYTFGLRHAVDADHISAIDNTTRKLMRDGQRPVGVGFFFSMGHSTIVVALAIGLAAATGVVQHNLPGLQRAGTIIGTVVSCLFLLLIAALNLIVLQEIYRTFRTLRSGGSFDDAAVDAFLDQRGLLARVLGPAVKLVDRSWKMYPVGVLFGLGFDTASEVAILALSAISASGHLPLGYVLILPLLFAAGMSLIDTTDAVLMLGAYGWAFIKPVRKLYYNLNITLISVLIALFVALVEALQVVSIETGLKNGIWRVLSFLNFETMGYGIIAIFLVSWGASTLVYKARGYDKIGEEPGPAPLNA